MVLVWAEAKWQLMNLYPWFITCVFTNTRTYIRTTECHKYSVPTELRHKKIPFPLGWGSWRLCYGVARLRYRPCVSQLSSAMANNDILGSVVQQIVRYKRAHSVTSRCPWYKRRGPVRWRIEYTWDGDSDAQNVVIVQQHDPVLGNSFYNIFLLLILKIMLQYYSI